MQTEKIVICPICKSTNCKFVIEQKNVPVVQNIVYHNRKDSLEAIKDDIDLYYCDTCTHIFNASFKSYEQYNLKYDNSQINSDYFRKYIESVMQYISGNVNLKGKSVLEIGCGQGDFINLISQNEECFCFGFDPSLKNQIDLERTTLYNEFFDEKYAELFEQKIDVVILRHIIEHIKEPNEIMINICKVLKDNGYVYVEVPSCEYILKSHSFFDILYEHCNYFNLDSLRCMMNISEMEVVDYFYGFDNQYLGILAVKRSKVLDLVGNNKTNDIQLNDIIDFKENIYIIENKIIEFIRNKSNQGKFAFWGAGAKGMMSCNLFDKNRKYVDCVIDIKKSREGTYIGGTGHIVISPDNIFDRNIKHILVLNPNYYDEILMQVNSLDLGINVYNMDSIIKGILELLNTEGI